MGKKSKSKSKSRRKILRHLVLDGTTTRSTNNTNTITTKEYSGSKTLETIKIIQSSNISCIGEFAFRDCKSLQSVHLPDGVTKIEEGAFAGCSSLQSVHIEDTTVTTIEKVSFRQCSSLQSIHLPAGVTSIKKGAFGFCSSLQTLHLPDGLKSIEELAFGECYSLQSLHLPDSLTSIGKYAFAGCISLPSLHFPDSLTSVGQQAFYECSSLRSIYIPNAVTTVVPNAFDLCKTLLFVHRHREHPNYHFDTITWLRQRFNNLPLHRACYDHGYNNNNVSSSALDKLSTIIQENKQALAITDAMGMLPLHILCCNPHATAELMQIVAEGEPSLLTHTDATGCTPLQVYLICRNLLETDQSIPSLEDLLEKGIKCEDLDALSVLDSNGEIDLLSRDKSTGLSPFMSAAVVKACGLDVMHTLAMMNLEGMI